MFYYFRLNSYVSLLIIEGFIRSMLLATEVLINYFHVLVLWTFVSSIFRVDKKLVVPKRFWLFEVIFSGEGATDVYLVFWKENVCEA